MAFIQKVKLFTINLSGYLNSVHEQDCGSLICFHLFPRCHWWAEVQLARFLNQQAIIKAVNDHPRLWQSLVNKFKAGINRCTTYTIFSTLYNISKHTDNPEAEEAEGEIFIKVSRKFDNNGCKNCTDNLDVLLCYPFNTSNSNKHQCRNKRNCPFKNSWNWKCREGKSFRRGRSSSRKCYRSKWRGCCSWNNIVSRHDDAWSDIRAISGKLDRIPTERESLGINQRAILGLALIFHGLDKEFCRTSCQRRSKIRSNIFLFLRPIDDDSFHRLSGYKTPTGGLRYGFDSGLPKMAKCELVNSIHRFYELLDETIGRYKQSHLHASTFLYDTCSNRNWYNIDFEKAHIWSTENDNYSITSSTQQ